MSDEIKAMEGIQMWERPEITWEQSTTGEYPMEIDGNSKVRAWLMVEEDEDERYDDIWITMLSSFPYPYPSQEAADANPKMVPQHNVDYEIDNIGIEEFAGIGRGEEFEDIQAFMAKHGLESGQPFRAELFANYFKCGSYDCEEWDCEMSLEVLEKGKKP